MLTKEQINKILELKGKGYSKYKIAKKLGVSWDTVNRHCNDGEEGENELKGKADIARIFRELDNGKSAIDLIKEGLATPEGVKKALEDYNELKGRIDTPEAKNRIEALERRSEASERELEKVSKAMKESELSSQAKISELIEDLDGITAVLCYHLGKAFPKLLNILMTGLYRIQFRHSSNGLRYELKEKK